MLEALFLSAVLSLQVSGPADATPPPAGASPAAVASVVPTKTYYAPSQPMKVLVSSAAPVELMLVDFIGRSTSARSAGPVSGEVDLRQLFREPLADAGTYQLLAVPPGGTPADFVATPLLITVRADTRRAAQPGPMIYRIEPLQYALFSTTAGEMRVCFYYDTAPNSVAAIRRLIADGFYDGLPFFRIEPGFVVQTGDPRADGTGGPGFFLDAEFSDRQHLEGVLSLARLTDPNEAPGLLPRPEFANSGGSQFFIALGYETTRQLDRRYTVFARVVDGLDTLRTLAATPLDSKTSRPIDPPTITSARLVTVTPTDNPYARLRIVDPNIGRPQASTPAVPEPVVPPATQPAATPAN